MVPFPQPLLFRSYINPLFPCLVTSAPEDGNSKFLRNVSIDLQTTRFQDPRLQQQQHNGNVFSGSGATTVERPLGRPRHRWEDVIRMDLRERAWGVWIGFDRLRIGTSGGLL
jgi:hypothetical protein